MFLQSLKNFIIALSLIPAAIFAQMTDTMQDTIIDGAAANGAAAGWWWFWVIMLLAIVGIAIWWAARTGAQGESMHPRGGAGAPRT